jgi:hypothetical protein
MAFDISRLDLLNIDTLRDQLIGVDMLYFQKLMHFLQQRQITGTALDNDYLLGLIDECF